MPPLSRPPPVGAVHGRFRPSRALNCHSLACGRACIGGEAAWRQVKPIVLPVKKKSPTRRRRACQRGWSSTRKVSLPLLPSGPGGVHGLPLPDHKGNARAPAIPSKWRARLAGLAQASKAFFWRQALPSPARPPCARRPGLGIQRPERTIGAPPHSAVCS